jgi:plastocyanin
MRIRSLIAPLAVAALIAACSDSTSAGGTGGRSTTITVGNNFFTPSPDTMAAGQVTFTWAGSGHNVTWLTGPSAPANSSTLSSPNTYQAPLVAGTYTYHCTVHAGMNGTIVVQ